MAGGQCCLRDQCPDTVRGARERGRYGEAWRCAGPLQWKDRGRRRDPGPGCPGRGTGGRNRGRRQCTACPPAAWHRYPECAADRTVSGGRPDGPGAGAFGAGRAGIEAAELAERRIARAGRRRDLVAHRHGGLGAGRGDGAVPADSSGPAGMAGRTGCQGCTARETRRSGGRLRRRWHAGTGRDARPCTLGRHEKTHDAGLRGRTGQPGPVGWHVCPGGLRPGQKPGADGTDGGPGAQ